MSNKRALWSYDETKRQIERCNYIIATTKNWKTKKDFQKNKDRLIKELKEYEKNRGL